MTADTLDTRMLETDGATIVYDVQGPLPPADGIPVLLMVGQPMDASGFRPLAAHFSDRTVVTYDPRGFGRSTRSDGEVTNSPTVQAEDLHALIRDLGAGAVEVFASSGGAVSALALVTAYPGDVAVLVAHEPPLLHTLPDAEAAQRATQATQETYQAKGWGAGMASFLAMTMWRGEFTDEYFAQPTPDPAQFGLPTEDDGSRDDPLMTGHSAPIAEYRLDVEALKAAPTRVVLGVGEESRDTFTGRTAIGTAELLGQEAVVFPSHHGGFAAEETGYPGKPREFAERLREVLEG